MRKLFLLSGLLALSLLFTNCKGDKEIASKNYNPNEPLKLLSFFPDSGGLAEQVILKGANFGSDKDELRVYFNKKKAYVINAMGDVAYVVAPRLPGDTCIVSVVIGKDSLQYEKPFYYKSQIQISTIAGNNFAEEGHEDGTLVEARFARPYYIAVDKEKNIFVGQYPSSISGTIRMINEEKNLVMTVYKSSAWEWVVSGTCSPTTQTIYFPIAGNMQYIELDPKKEWGPRRITPRLKAGQTFDINHLKEKYGFAVSPDDDMIYTITKAGELIKINPKTHEAELVMNGILKDRLEGNVQAYLVFDPRNPHMLYFTNPSSMVPWDGPIPGTDRIYRIDLRNNIMTPYAGSGTKGYLDGPANLAQFNNPCQICFDKDGILYVADTDNYCVRKISADGIVSTVLGIPGKDGYMDGSPENAEIGRIWGMYIDDEGTLYIADYYHKCVRKLTIG